MNPLDKEEYSEFLNIMDKSMPFHTDTRAKIPYTYKMSMPKDLLQESINADYKFINNNQHLIEEIQYRDKSHFLSNWMKIYQNKIYGKYDILSRDNFYNMVKSKHRGMLPFAGMTLGFGAGGKLLGATLTTGDTSATVTVGAGAVMANKNTVGVVGSFYNQMAEDCNNSLGNLNLGLFTDNGSSVPSALYSGSQVAEYAADSAFTTKTCNGEFSLTGTTNWLAFQNSNASFSAKWNSTTGSNHLDTTAYASTMPSTWANDGGNFSRAFHMSLSHT